MTIIVLVASLHKKYYIRTKRKKGVFGYEYSARLHDKRNIENSIVAV